MITCAFLFTAALAALLPSTSVSAEEPSVNVDIRPITILVLTSAWAGINPNSAPDEFAVLRCNPPRGKHPYAEQACETIRAANGDIEKVNVNPEGLCPDIYNPITVTAQGWWNGKKVSYSKTFGNSCQLSRTTGAIFAFSQQVAGCHKSSGGGLISSRRRHWAMTPIRFRLQG
ncbi:SSI family serine proteinase inhibitor [Streptomyces noursei]|uniref:SSI family serine proteinase inhibitor n=1 Tax=Streptomyces noursei TaxID=1971 RepID=UPI0033E0202A